MTWQINQDANPCKEQIDFISLFVKNSHPYFGYSHEILEMMMESLFLRVCDIFLLQVR